MTFLIVITALCLLAALQGRMPTMWWLGGLRLEWLPALAAYGALTFQRRRWVILLSFAAGCFQDALSGAPFGITACGLAVAGLMLHSLARTFERDTLWMQMLAGWLASVAASIAALCVVGITIANTGKLLALALIASLIAPLLFLVLDGLRYRERVA